MSLPVRPFAGFFACASTALLLIALPVASGITEGMATPAALDALRGIWTRDDPAPRPESRGIESPIPDSPASTDTTAIAAEEGTEGRVTVQRRVIVLPHPSEMLGRWRVVAISRFAPDGGETEVEVTRRDAVVEFDGITASFAPCRDHAFAYRYTNDGHIEALRGSARSSDFGCTGKTPTDRDRADEIMAALASRPWLEKRDDGAMVMGTASREVKLVRPSRRLPA